MLFLRQRLDVFDLLKFFRRELLVSIGRLGFLQFSILHFEDVLLDLGHVQYFLNRRSDWSLLLKEHVHQLVEYLVVGIAELLVVRLRYLGVDCMEAVAFEWAAEGAELIQDATQHPHVRFVVVFLSHANLGGQVVWRTRLSLGHVQRIVELLWDAKVTNFSFVVFGEEDVLRLDVSVNDVPLVDVPQGQSELAKPVKYLLFRQTCVLLLPGLLDLHLKVAILCIFSHNTQLLLFVHKRFMVFYYVWVIQGLQDFDLVIQDSLGLFVRWIIASLTLGSWSILTGHLKGKLLAPFLQIRSVPWVAVS